MVTIESVEIFKDATRWTMTVTPRLQRLVERIGVYHDEPTHEVLSRLIREAIEATEKQVLISKVDSHIEAALKDSTDPSWEGYRA